MMHSSLTMKGQSYFIAAGTPTAAVNDLMLPMMAWTAREGLLLLAPWLLRDLQLKHSKQTCSWECSCECSWEYI